MRNALKSAAENAEKTTGKISTINELLYAVKPDFEALAKSAKTEGEKAKAEKIVGIVTKFQNLFEKAISEGDAGAYEDLKLMTNSYDVTKPKDFIDLLYAIRNASEKEAKGFGKSPSAPAKYFKYGSNKTAEEERSEMENIEKIFHEVKQYGNKTRRVTSPMGNDVLYKAGQAVGAKSVDEQLDTVLQLLQKVNFSKLDKEVKRAEKVFVKAHILDNALLQINNQKVPNASVGKNFLDSLTEDDVKGAGLSEALHSGAHLEQKIEQAKKAVVDAIVNKQVLEQKIDIKIIEPLFKKQSEYIDNFNNPGSEKKKAKINAGQIQFFAEKEALGNLGFSETEQSQQREELLNIKMNAKAKVYEKEGLKTETVEVPPELVAFMTAHFKKLIQTEEEEMTKLITDNYEKIAAIFSDAYGIRKEELYETLEDWITRQKELGKALRGLTQREPVKMTIKPAVFSLKDRIAGKQQPYVT